MEYHSEEEGLKVQHLKVDFKIPGGIVHAVKDVSLEVKKGKITALVGESGSGKSVTSLAIMGLLPSNLERMEGEITLDGISLSAMSKREHQSQNGKLAGMIFQDPLASLDPLFTIGNQMVEGIRRHQKLKKKLAEEIALEQLRAVNLPNPESLMGKYPFELSGGMCQRVMIAMTMALKPKYLIADEATTALDVTIQKQILSEIYRMSRQEHMGVLFITHDLGVVAEIADEVCIMQDGVIVESADVFEIFEHPSSEYTKILLEAIL
jgi:ABC-type dipeptide/oligopeptide/nickel transport system ATPase component